MPRFLDTCVGQPRKVVLNHGVEIVTDEAQLVGRVVRLCRQWVQKVPVLVITSGPEELAKVHAAVREADGIVADEVQRFSQFDEQGHSLKDQWETLIADATKRLGGSSDNRCRVTVTDRFGGRGHDYQVIIHPCPPLPAWPWRPLAPGGDTPSSSSLCVARVFACGNGR